jgi:flagellar protein FlaG
VQRNLEFSIDDSTGAVVVKVIAKASGELIRQLPSEEALKLAQSLKSENPALIQDKV